MAVIFSGIHGRSSGLGNPLLKWLKKGQENSQINCSLCGEACKNSKVRVGDSLGVGGRSWGGTVREGTWPLTVRFSYLSPLGLLVSLLGILGNGGGPVTKLILS